MLRTLKRSVHELKRDVPGRLLRGPDGAEPLETKESEKHSLASAGLTEDAMDIVKAVAIQLRCKACGSQYELGLNQVLLSQKMLHEGCPVQIPNECPPLAYANLVKPEQIENLRRAWIELDESVRAAGGSLLLVKE